MDTNIQEHADSHLSANSRIVRNILALGFGQVFTWGSTFALVILLPGSLGAERLGKLTTAISIADFSTLIAVLGITSYMTKEFARKGSEADVMNALATRLPLIVLGCLMAALAGWVFGYDAETRRLIYILCTGVAMSGIAAVLAGTLQGMQDMRSYALGTTLSKLSLIALVALALSLGWGLTGVAVAWMLQNVVLVVVCAVPLLRKGMLRGSISLGTWGPLLAGSMPFFVWQASLMFYGQIDVVLLSLFTRDEVVGWYGAAYRIIAIPVFIPVIITSAVFPALSRYAMSDQERLLAVARRSMQIVLISTIPLSLGMMIVAPRLLGVLHYSSEYDNAVPLIIILAIHVPFMGADMILGAVMNASDRQRTWAYTGVAAAVFNPAINAILIPYFDHAHGNGAIGAAMSTVFTELFMMTAALIYLRGSVLDGATRSVALRCAASGALMVGAVWLARGLPLPVSILVGGVTYGLATLALGVIRISDVNDLRRYVSSRATAGAAVSA